MEVLEESSFIVRVIVYLDDIVVIIIAYRIAEYYLCEYLRYRYYCSIIHEACAAYRQPLATQLSTSSRATLIH
jgi:hypothetical protein